MTTTDLVTTYANDFDGAALAEIAAAAGARALLLRGSGAKPGSPEWGFADDLSQLAAYARRVVDRQTEGAL